MVVPVSVASSAAANGFCSADRRYHIGSRSACCGSFPEETMRIAVLGTGMVGRAHARKLAAAGHTVVIGTGDVQTTLRSTDPDSMGNPPFSLWHKDNADVQLATFAAAAGPAEVAINALNGVAALKVLKSFERELDAKTLLDISNPLDFSRGFPPTLSICNTTSLGEQIQSALPRVKVVKTLNTMTAAVQIDPEVVAGGDHANFMAGNDAETKTRVSAWLREWYGWSDTIDLGDITSARGMEMVLPLWLRLLGPMKTAMFNFKIVR
jgi:predicted dinucleotide-binding enzyme